MDSTTLLPFKAILMSIRSIETIKHVSGYINEMFQDGLLNQLRKKHASEDLFEVYFLAMEISDSLARNLIHSKVVKRASRLSQKSLSLFPVITLVVQWRLIVSCSVYYGWRRSAGAVRKRARRSIRHVRKVYLVQFNGSTLRWSHERKLSGYRLRLLGLWLVGGYHW